MKPPIPTELMRKINDLGPLSKPGEKSRRTKEENDIAERRRSIEEIQERRALEQELKEVWL